MSKVNFLKGLQMSEASDSLKQKFVENVKLRGYDDKYIDRHEEKEILQQAVSDGITIESARQSLAQVCEANDYVLESRALETVENAVATFAENDGKVDEKEYHDAVTIAKKATRGKKTENECKRFVLHIMDDRGYQAKTGLFSNWFKKEKQTVGV